MIFRFLVLLLFMTLVNCGDKEWDETVDEYGVITFKCDKDRCNEHNTFLNEIKSDGIKNSLFNISDWGGWKPVGEGCQSAAEQLLVQASEVEPALTSNGCRVVAGKWLIGGQYVFLRKDLTVAHIAPPSWAFKNGADVWSAEKKSSFFNDQTNLILLTKSGARERMNREPSEWVPDDPVNRSKYLKAWSKLRAEYGLWGSQE